MSWESLDKTREECRRKIDEDEVELMKIMTRLLKNKGVLRQAEERAKKRAECLMNDMEASGELDTQDTLKGCIAFDATDGLSPQTASSLDLINFKVDFPAVDLEILAGDTALM